MLSMSALQKHLLCLLFLFSPISPKLGANSNERIEALLLVDSESNLKNSVKKDGQLMLNILNKVAKATDMELQATLLQGNDVTAFQIQKWLNNLSHEPHDVVLFYFSGHGCKSDSALIPWPYLFLSTKQRLVALADIIKLIESQKSRLSIVFADCCNGSMKEKRMVLPFLVQGVPSKATSPVSFGIETLFKSTKGHIRAIAAQRGQSALAYNKGSLFTMALDRSLQKEFKRPETSWNAVLNRTKRFCGSLQKPYVSIEVE